MVDAPEPDAAPEPALTPANQNPWYVLATLHGEQPEGARPSVFDREIRAKNRLTWNKWAAGALSEEQRRVLGERRDGSGQRVYTEQELTPYTAKEIAALKRRWRREWTGRNPSLPIIPLPNAGQVVDCTSVHFDRGVIWSGFIVPAGAAFHSATFSSNAFFSDAMFSDYAVFENANFSGDVFFDNATFSRYAVFEKANFSGYSAFGKVTFSSYAGFMKATFSGVAIFGKATFSTDAGFENATFSRFASFEEVTFSGDVEFEKATFSGNAAFEKATFSGDAEFLHATFSGRIRFANTKLNSPTSFAGARFTLHPPRFHGASLHEGTQWHGAQWPPPPDDAEDAQQHVYAYERLKQEMERLKKHDDELQFFEREMRCRRMVEDQHLPAGRLKRVFFLLKGNGWSGLLNRAYDCFSGYGRSILRPTLGLIATFVLGIAAMMSAACWPGRAGSCPAILTLDSPFIAFKQAILLSFANMLAPLNVRKDFFDAKMLAELSGWLKIVGGLQTLLALGFAFLIGLALRNRFRLR